MAASSDHLTRLKNIRDNLEKELENETSRRAALTEAGKPAPATYSLGGKSVSWSEYVSSRIKDIKELNEMINMAGADGGIPDFSLKGYC